MVADGQQPEPFYSRTVKLEGIHMYALQVDSYVFMSCNEGVETKLLDQKSVERPDNALFQPTPAGLCRWYTHHGSADTVPGEI